MVAYVKNNILLVVITVLLIFASSSYARFSTKVTESEIKKICTQQDINNATHCFEFLKSSPEIAKMDLTGLEIFVINHNSRITSDMHKQFQSLTNTTTDRIAKRSYRACSETFDLAITNLDDALKALATKDYQRLNIELGSSIGMADTCNQELSNIVVKLKPNPQLFKGISTVKNLSSIALAILECFIVKEREYC